MYYFYSTRMYYDHNTCIICSRLVFDALQVGGSGGRNSKGKQGVLGGSQARFTLCWYKKVTCGDPLELGPNSADKPTPIWIEESI